MEFVEITGKEHDDFIKNHPLNNFLQSSLMDSVSKGKSQTVYYVGVKKNKKLICSARIIAFKNKFGKSYFSSPRGFIIDYRDNELLNFFLKNLKKFIKQRSGYELTIEPNLFYKQRDINGDIVDGGFDNTDIINILEKNGFKHRGFTTGTDMSKQIRWQFSIDLRNKTLDEVYSDFKQNTRNLISKSMKSGITIEELKYEDLSRFKKITEETSNRIGFKDKTLEYYNLMYKSFVSTNNAKFLIATINLKEYLENIKEQRVSIKAKIKKMEDKGHISEGFKTRYEEYNSQILNLDKKIDSIKQMIKEDGEKIDLSASLFITYGNEITYLFSGNIEKYMNFNAQYLIQWKMIKYAVENHYDKYNFYGISGIFDKEDSNYGVYKFKKSFNGIVEEYIGEFSMPLSIYYYINKIIKRIKK